MTSRTGIGFIGMTLVLLLGSCNYGEVYVEPYVEPKQRYSRPTECRHLYDTGQHKAWAACMGVSYDN
jgi:hypothetical protein